MKFSKRQQGVALLTALLIVALATIISVSISKQIQLDVRHTGNILANEQALLYALTAEDWSRRILRKDWEDDNENNKLIDHHEEDWATDIQGIPIEGGTIGGKLHDLQACINLNSLFVSGAPVPLAQDRLRQLLANLQADPDLNLNINPNAIIQSIVDWIDDDQNTTIPDGAEDSYYMNLEKPYRTANANLFSISELRVIKGFEENETFDALKNDDQKNLVCAVAATTGINVNTAPVEVLQSLGNNMSDSDAQDIVSNRPYDNIPDFVSRNAPQITFTSTDNLVVSTSYFLLETTVNIGQARTLMYSIIQRGNNGDTTVIARSQGAY